MLFTALTSPRWNSSILGKVTYVKGDIAFSLQHALGKEFISQAGGYVTVKLQLLFFLCLWGQHKLLDVNK